jgi:hypothetical protein
MGMIRIKRRSHVVNSTRQETGKFGEFLSRKKEEYGSKFDSSDLSQKFVSSYNSGERVKVKFRYGETKTGTVGVTTGWKPVFLLMLTSRSRGSSHTLSDKDEIVR